MKERIVWPVIGIAVLAPLSCDVMAGTCVARFGSSAFGSSQFGTNGTGCTASVQAPGQPTITSATAGNQQITVAFVPGSGDAADSYTATCVSSNGGATGTVTGIASPIVVTGLTNGKGYACAVTASNTAGNSTPSASSPVVTPVIPPQPNPIPTLSQWAMALMILLLSAMVGRNAWLMQRR